MTVYPLYEKRKVISCNGLWDFEFKKDFDFLSPDLASLVFPSKIVVPGVWDAFPDWRGARGCGAFRTYLEIPVGKRAKLNIGAIGMYAKVFIDRKEYAFQDSPYVPVEIEIPASDKAARELIVLCDNRFNYSICNMFELYFDFYAYGGIFRDVELQILPEGAYIDWVGVDTLDWKKAKLKVTVKSTEKGSREVRIMDGAKTVLSEKRSFESGSEVFELEWPSKEAWSSEKPALHLLTVDTGNDSVTVRFGIRQVRTEKGQILVNDKVVKKLLGYCRHESHAQFGPALPLSQLLADIQILKDMGCNFVRGSHYPQDPRFLDLCDENGILFWEESLGWGQKATHFTDPKFVASQVDHTKKMIRASYNHPCIIMRGFLNEGETIKEEGRPCYETLVNLIRKEDPTRLVSYATMFDLRDLFLELCDVISFNTYPGWYAANCEDEHPLGEILPRLRGFVEKLKERGLGDRPLIISEIGAAALYGWRDPICSQWSEEYQSEYLKTACEEIIANPGIAGVALWQFCDGRTYRGSRSLGRPRTFNNKGTFDEYRRPKMAFHTVKKLFTEASK